MTKKYGLILSDPPWKFQNFSVRGHGKGAAKHYDCVSIEELAKIPVKEWAADSSLMFMWATFAMLPEAMKLMQEWGFTYKTGGAWHKRTKNGKSQFGTGYWLRSSCEPFLIGTRGKPKIKSRNIRNIIEAAVREHSRKPDAQYQLCEALADGPYLEMFARQKWSKTWDTYGFETEKFTVYSQKDSTFCLVKDS